jgi:patatin-related protein
MLRFRYTRLPGGGGEYSDFTRANVPSLVFAARASSSFPGAFRPAQLREIEAVANELGAPWTTKEAFLAANFRRYRQAGSDPHRTSFVDGAVLNNKPFASAIAAIRGRPAYREIDRRLVYIDPDPEQPPPPPDGRVPNWFRTLKGALSDIPRNQPIFDDLEWINAYNQRVRRIKAIIDDARPQVVKLVHELAGQAIDQPLSTDTLGVWREAANARAAVEAGFVYDGYVRLKLASVMEYLGTLAAEMAGYPARSPTANRIGIVLHSWAERRAVLPPAGAVPRSGNVVTSEPPPWVRFVLRFDLAFRQRRLAFVIRGLNLLYGRIGDTGFAGVSAANLDRLKADFYGAMDAMRRFNDHQFASPELQNRFAQLFSPLSRSDDLLEKDWFDPEAFVERNASDLDAAIDALADAINLRGLNRIVDRVVAAIDPASVGATAKREILIAYLGFAFWDMLTFSLTTWRDAGEYEEIRVDRISPDDADTLRQGGAEATLKGIGFSHFGAFFSRRNRENDYLWGRLHAADRMIDILVDAAGREDAGKGVDIVALKRRAFATILNSEAKALPAIAPMIAELRTEIARLH